MSKMHTNCIAVTLMISLLVHSMFLMPSKRCFDLDLVQLNWLGWPRYGMNKIIFWLASWSTQKPQVGLKWRHSWGASGDILCGMDIRREIHAWSIFNVPPARICSASPSFKGKKRGTPHTLISKTQRNSIKHILILHIQKQNHQKSHFYHSSIHF